MSNARGELHVVFFPPLLRLVCAFSVFLVFTAFPAKAESAGLNAASDGPVADRYLSWAMAAAEEGRWEQAEKALERGADFAASSSDLSYLLALARLKMDRPLRSVLASVRQSLETNRWLRWSPSAARLLEAEILIKLREFEAAASSLSGLERDPTVAYLRLLAVDGLGDGRAFNSGAADFLAAWPFDARVPRLILNRLARRLPSDAERSLVDTVIRRLDSLAETDPSLLYLSAPFVRDLETRRRMVETYRGARKADAGSIPIALDLGLIQDGTAVEELFSAASLEPTDAALFGAVWKLLRDQGGREAFARQSSLFSGTLVRDGDGDGRPETLVRFAGGIPVFLSHDADQDGLDEISMEFSDGLPVRASIPFERSLPESGNASGGLPLKIEWSRYPHIGTATVGGLRFIPARADFPFAPVRLSPLVPQLPSFRFPEVDFMVPRLTERSLVSFSSVIERGGFLREGSVETIELVAGTPRRSTERVGASVVASTTYDYGRPSVRQVDQDGDGRLETRQRFAPLGSVPFPLDPLPFPAFSESDWDGDGIYEYTEKYRADGTADKTWRDDGGRLMP